MEAPDAAHNFIRNHAGVFDQVLVETLRFFLREGVQWRELPGADGRASGSTLRRRLREWRDTAVLPRVHAVLLRMSRCDPERAARELRSFNPCSPSPASSSSPI